MTTTTELVHRIISNADAAQLALANGQVIDCLNHLRAACAAAQELERRELGIEPKEGN